MLKKFHNIIKNINVIKNINYKDIFLLEKNLSKNNNFIKFNNNNVCCVNTGKFTGRTPDDRYIVSDNITENTINWNNINKPINPEIFSELYYNVNNYYKNLNDIFLYEGYCGSDKKYQKKIDIYTEHVWQHHFVKNMFINDINSDISNVSTDFTIINASDYVYKNHKKYDLNSENFVILNIKDKIGIIGGTGYMGEMKKGIFSLMNYWLPLNNILTMHCSANIGKNGDTTLFFGLSGTGKTALSVDPNRLLIGDDEHGWGENGIFNLEGGCYAKTLNLSKKHEPDIYNAIKTNAILENVYINGNGNIDYFNDSITENGRVSYPINHVENHIPSLLGNHPNNIVFLICDAIGVMPIVSKLTLEQAIDYFLLGYTSKVAGTEMGIVKPQMTFSSCFGDAFMTLDPKIYSNLLKDKINKHDVNVYLVNTGWIGGQYGSGERVSIDVSRKCITSLINGDIDKYGYNTNNVFNLKIPNKIDGIDTNLLNPMNGWKDKNSYIKHANELKNEFDIKLRKYI